MTLNGQYLTWFHSFPKNVTGGIFFGSRPNKFVRTFDALHEKMRWKSRFTGRLLQLIDLIILFPFLKWIPKVDKIELSATLDKMFEVQIPDLLFLFRWKYLAIMEFFITNTSADFLLTTNASCYVNIPRLLQIIETLPNHKLYAGAPIPDVKYPEYYFASGSNRILSRDLVELILKDRRKWNCFLLEDLSLGRMMRKADIEPKVLNNINLDSMRAIDSMTHDEFNRHFSFRLKSYKIDDGTGELDRNDLNLMKYLHSKFSIF